MTAIKSARAEVEELVSELKARIQAVCFVHTSVSSIGRTDFVQTSNTTHAAAVAAAGLLIITNALLSPLSSPLDSNSKDSR